MADIIVELQEKTAELIAQAQEPLCRLAVSRDLTSRVEMWGNGLEAKLHALQDVCAEAEAELALSREQTEYANDAMMAMCKRAEQAEATIEQLKVCGGCKNFGSGSAYEFVPLCFAGQWDESYESFDGPKAIKTNVTDYHHHCHFTPSRWEPREGGE